MVDEYLYISPEIIRIRFKFFNPTANDAQTMVAFPLPEIGSNFWNSPIGIIINDPNNFVGFKAIIDGKHVSVNVEQHAFIKDNSGTEKDITKQLIELGVPINPIVDNKRFSDLPLLTQKKLISNQFADDDLYGPRPNWNARTKFFWKQTFPAKKTVVIEHSYQPIAGSFLFSTRDQERTKNIEDVNYCFDKSTWGILESRTNKKLAQNADGGGYIDATRIDYILSTATNWHGPIGHFHLILDKLKSDNVMSLCWSGKFKKTSSTTFEFTEDNFIPTQDIHMIILK